MRDLSKWRGKRWESTPNSQPPFLPSSVMPTPGCHPPGCGACIAAAGMKAQTPAVQGGFMRHRFIPLLSSLISLTDTFRNLGSNG